MSVSQIIDTLNKGVEVVNDVAAIAKKLGFDEADNIAKVVTALSNVAENVYNRIEEGQIVASISDRITIRAIIADLATENDKLAERIARS